MPWKKRHSAIRYAILMTLKEWSFALLAIGLILLLVWAVS